MYAQYTKDFGKNHHFDVMGGYEWQHFHKETDYYYYGTYPDTNKEHPGEIKDPSENTLYKTENYLVSFFGRLNYSLMDRYLLTVTLRNDGSSRFHKDNRWGLFPSVAAAWKINEEAFLKDSKVVSDLKLRQVGVKLVSRKVLAITLILLLIRLMVWVHIIQLQATV